MKLAEVIQGLRKELACAMEAGRGKSLAFDVNHIEVELWTTIEKSGEVQAESRGTLKFFVEIGANIRGSERETSSRTHLIRLQLTPVLPDSDQEDNSADNQKVRLSARQ